MSQENHEQQPARTRMRGSERRAFILRQSKKVFAEKGYAGASTSELARASEVTEPVLYKHFGSKQKLFMALLEWVTSEFIEDFRRRVEARAQHDLLDALASMIVDYRAAVLADMDRRNILMISTEIRDPEVVEGMIVYTQQLFEFVYGLVSEAHVRGLLAEHLDLTAAAWGLTCVMLANPLRVKLDMTEQVNVRTLKEVGRLWIQSLKIG